MGESPRVVSLPSFLDMILTLIKNKRMSKGIQEISIQFPIVKSSPFVRLRILLSA